MKILIVDDDRATCSLISGHINERMSGVDISIVYSYEAAISCINKNYDWIIVDLVLPGGDGYNFAKRYCNRHSDTRVAIISGHRREIERVQLDMSVNIRMIVPKGIVDWDRFVRVLRREVLTDFEYLKNADISDEWKSRIIRLEEFAKNQEEKNRDFKTGIDRVYDKVEESNLRFRKFGVALVVGVYVSLLGILSVIIGVVISFLNR